MSISGIKGFTPTLIDSTKPQPKLDTTNTTKDEVLNLSDPSQLADELLHQDISTIKAIKIGDQLLAIKPEDVKKLVEALKKACLDNSGLKDNFKMIGFSQKTGITVESSDFTDKNAAATMAKRAELRLNIKDNTDISKAVGADIKLIDTKYKNSPSVAGKMLMQDMSLLERKGLLSPEDKAIYKEIMNKYVENYNNQKKTGSTDFISKEDVGRLYAIAAKAAGNTSAKGLTADQGALVGLGKDGTGTTAAKYDTVVKNKDAVLAAGDAAMDDARIATKEVGKGDGVEGGRSFVRMQKSIDELGKQFHTINDQMMPAVAAQVKDLGVQMDARVMELAKENPKYKDLKTPMDVKIAMATDPELAAKINGDPQLKKLNAAQGEAINTYKELGSKSLELGEARIQALKEYKSVNTIFTDEQTRTGSAQVMTAKLALGSQKLEKIQAKIDALNLQSMDPGVKQQQLDSLKGEIKAIKEDMISSMKGLIDTYNKTSTKNPDAVKLLNAQLATLNALDIDPTKIKATIESLEGVRKGYIGALEKSVPIFVSEKEVKALKSLDKGISDFVTGKMAADGKVVMTNDMIQLQIDEAKHEKDDATSKGMHDLEAMEGNHPEEGHEAGEHHEIPRFALAYGSHAKVSLELGAGIGFGVGDAIKAKIALSVEAALTVEKAFSQSEKPYLIHADLSLKLTGDLTLAHIFEAHGEIKAGLSAGLAFKDLGEAKAFGIQLAKVVALASAIGEIGSAGDIEKLQAQLDKEMDKLGGMIKKYGYTGTLIEIKGDAKSELPGAEVGLEGGWKRETNTFSDGKKVQNDHYKGKLEIGHFGVAVVVDKSKILNPKAGEKSEDWSRVVGQITIPKEIFKHAIEHGSFDQIPKNVLEEIVKQFNKLNPGMAQLSVGILLSHLNTAIKAAKASNGMALAKLADQADKGGKSAAEVTIGIEFVTEGKKQYAAVELGVEAKKSYTVDTPITGGFIRTGVAAELELGMAIKVWENHPEEADTGNIYGKKE